MEDFGRLLANEIPRLRRYARALTRRNAAIADDLVQDCLVRAVAKQHLWQPGTNLRAWLFTIMHNQHVNYVRRAVKDGDHVGVDEIGPLPVEGNAEPTLALRDLRAAMEKLSIEQRQAILLVGLEGLNYEQAARILNVPIGTIRSRLSRGREELRRLMDITERPAKSPEPDTADVPGVQQLEKAA